MIIALQQLASANELVIDDGAFMPVEKKPEERK